MGMEKEPIHSYQHALNWGKQEPGPKEQNVPTRILLKDTSGDATSGVGVALPAGAGG